MSTQRWQVVRILHGGGVQVVSEHRSWRVAEFIAFVRDALMVVNGRANQWDYDARPKPAGAANPVTDLDMVPFAARCKHGEQILNECVHCELDQLRERVTALEELTARLRAVNRGA